MQNVTNNKLVTKSSPYGKVVRQGLKAKKRAVMTSRDRLDAALNHKPVDRLCVDFGAGGQTGMGAGAVSRLRRAILGDQGHRVKITEPFQMLGEIDDKLKEALELDVVGFDPPNNMFGFKNEGWKPFEMNDGTKVLVPEKFNFTVDEKGNTLMYPEGDMSVPHSAVMPKTAVLFTGQGAQSPGMGKDIADAFAAARAIFDCAGLTHEVCVQLLSLHLRLPCLWQGSVVAWRSHRSRLPCLRQGNAMA